LQLHGATARSGTSGLTEPELLKALEGGHALRAASLTFRFWQ